MGMRTSRRSFVARVLSAGGALLVRAVPAAARRKDGRGHDKPLFADDFHRRDRKEWGRPWFNQRYERHWAIKDHAGVYKLSSSVNHFDYRPDPILVLDHDVADLDARASVTTSNVTARVGVVARATGYADYYAAYIGNGHLRLVRCGARREKLLGKARLNIREGTRYRVRLQVRGSEPVLVRAQAWRDGQPQPSRWQAEVWDDSEHALRRRGAFGALAAHGTNGKGATLRFYELIVRSENRPSVTAPAIAYSLVGPPAEGKKVRAVAKAAVPGAIRFRYGLEPNLLSDAITTDWKQTNRAQTAHAVLNLSSFPAAATVYWQAVARREGHKAKGPIGRFRTSPAPGLPVRFAFGACTKWEMDPHKSFAQARAKLAEFYLHQGDFGYARGHVAHHRPDCYQDLWVRMLMDPDLSALTSEMPFAFYMDDEDYGRNGADKASHRPFTIEAHRELNANPATPYFTFRYGGLAVFAIDCRRFSTGNDLPPKERSRLGERQTKWLKDVMRAAARDKDVGLLVLASPMAFGSDSEQMNWRSGYPEEWSKLMDFFQSLEAAVLIVSGNSHAHRLFEYPQKNLDPDVPRIVEFLSAGTERETFDTQEDPEFLVKEAKGSGFGLVDIGPEELSLSGERVRPLTLTAVKSEDGSTHWRATYSIVRGVGILPAAGVL